MITFNEYRALFRFNVQWLFYFFMLCVFIVGPIVSLAFFLGIPFLVEFLKKHYPDSVFMIDYAAFALICLFSLFILFLLKKTLDWSFGEYKRFVIRFNPRGQWPRFILLIVIQMIISSIVAFAIGGRDMFFDPLELRTSPLQNGIAFVLPFIYTPFVLKAFFSFFKDSYKLTFKPQMWKLEEDNLDKNSL